MRSVTNHRLSDHITIKECLRIITPVPITSIIRSKVLQLYGHIKRTQSGFSKICLNGMVQWKRSWGRQRKGWRDNIYELSGTNLPNLNTITQNQNFWREFCHVSAHSAVGGVSELRWYSTKIIKPRVDSYKWLGKSVIVYMNVHYISVPTCSPVSSACIWMMTNCPHRL